ncbi:GMC family oxidoreductase N-terminal domain-containing protein [Thalassotalea psychrophila]|uniref:GMC family oxidoreductase N-terminal domain-containing protein n=1 Tax=Thalassotalea psychrophila TaxID=3065647 RepID=A0ABY9TRR0_9GAMM|nr:GMC family oxidoreductase N-terminal domain-containing protein [Colwelliaceae bacterium SQ149]
MHDYIIIGGGSAGGVLANRLSEDNTIDVCLLEAGSKGKSPLISVPVGMAALIQDFKINKWNWKFNTQKDKSMNNRSQYQPRGKVLGGSSSINGMVYIRGDKTDYEIWSELGNTTWGYEQVLPYFKKAENNERGECEFHNVNGPLNVSDGVTEFDICDSFKQSILAQGYPYNSDFNGVSQEGVGVYQFTTKNGVRASTKACYIEPAMMRENLTVKTNSQVQRIIFDGKRAVGVEYIANGKTYTIKANKEVLVCGGSFNSPQLLLLSGVGPKPELDKHAIDVVHELSGVGKNLQEHPDVMLVYKSKTKSGLALNPQGIAKGCSALVKYLLNKTGWFANTVTPVGGFFKTDEHLTTPNFQIHSVPMAYRDHARDYKLMTNWGFSLLVNISRPKSRGEVTLKDSNPLSAPNIQLNLLDHPDDMSELVKAVKKAQEMVDQPLMNKHIQGPMHPQKRFSDDNEIEQYLREYGSHAYHPVGTCKMGNDDMAVVDERLKVHGLEGIRVVDASIMPTLVSGNTNASTIMIGEKAADMIKQDNQHS